MLTEVQRWTMTSEKDRHVLDLEWMGTGQTDVTVGKYPYGGLFVRMPWKKGIMMPFFHGIRTNSPP